MFVSDETLESRLTHQALRHLKRVGSFLFAAVIATYLIPKLYEWRPWLPADGVPIASLFMHHEEVPDVGGESGAYRVQTALPETQEEIPELEAEEEASATKPPEKPSSAVAAAATKSEEAPAPIAVRQVIEDP